MSNKRRITFMIEENDRPTTWRWTTNVREIYTFGYTEDEGWRVENEETGHIGKGESLLEAFLDGVRSRLTEDSPRDLEKQELARLRGAVQAAGGLCQCGHLIIGHDIIWTRGEGYQRRACNVAGCDCEGCRTEGSEQSGDVYIPEV